MSTFDSITMKSHVLEKCRQILQDLVTVTLMEHQVKGVLWMKNMEESEYYGGILADDMGLGKTLQAIVASVMNDHKTTLVICPKSLVINWKNEIQEKLTVPFKVGIYSGTERHLMKVNKYDFVIATYGTVERDYSKFYDKSPLFKHVWKRIILDESQFIKNENSNTTQAVTELNANYRWCLSGTPVQNNLNELFATTKFLQVPGWCRKDDFDENMSTSYVSEVMDKISLRRTKAILDLPKKTVTEVECILSSEERATYDASHAKFSRLFNMFCAQQRRANQECETGENLLGQEPVRQSVSFAQILRKFTLLRQCCNDSNMVKSAGNPTEDSDNCAPSSKTNAIMDLITKIRLGDSETPEQPQSKVIVFTQFLWMIKQVYKECTSRSIGALTFTGCMTGKRRDDTLKKFERDDSIQVIIMSTKCANVGLNITSANWVIIVEPWWNPFVDEQAMDRAHRLGQNRPVRVVKLFVANSIEEKIMMMQKTKREMVKDLWIQEGNTRSSSPSMMQNIKSILA